MKLRRGDSWAMRWQLLGPSDAPLDLTGASARMHLRTSDGTLMLDASGYLSLLPQGEIALFVPFTVMDAIPPGRYEFDLELTRPGQIRDTLDADELIIEQDVTV